eukprot:754970-Hanusia_phi.AAC.2
MRHAETPRSESLSSKEGFASDDVRKGLTRGSRKVSSTGKAAGLDKIAHGKQNNNRRNQSSVVLFFLIVSQIQSRSKHAWQEREGAGSGQGDSKSCTGQDSTREAKDTTQLDVHA